VCHDRRYDAFNVVWNEACEPKRRINGQNLDERKNFDEFFFEWKLKKRKLNRDREVTLYTILYKNKFPLKRVPARVARWYFFKPKLPIWVNFGGPKNEKCCYILCPYGIYYFHLVYSMVIWKFYCNLVCFSTFWYIVSRKIWQPWCQLGIFSFYL
jgi:hypothetical protein